MKSLLWSVANEINGHSVREGTCIDCGGDVVIYSDGKSTHDGKIDCINAVGRIDVEKLRQIDQALKKLS